MKPSPTRSLGSAAVLFLGGFILLLASPADAAQSVANAELDQGDDAPAGWTLSGGEGRWVDRQVLEVTGTGSDSNYWRSGNVEFEPGKLYRFQMRARRKSGSGCTISGPDFANHDYYGMSSDWKWHGHVFRAPENTEGAYLRLGQWQAKGSVEFDAVKLTPVLPVHHKCGDLVLGEGETILDGTYRFHGTFNQPGSNYHRTLESATAGFNSNRWVFGGGSEVVYLFQVPSHAMLSGKVSFNVNYHTRGGCAAEVSRNGKKWHPLVTLNGVTAGEAVLPDDLLPAEAISLRLRSTTPDGSFQVDRVELEAQLDGDPPEASGKTLFADVSKTGRDLSIEGITLHGDAAAGLGLSLAVRNATRWPVSEVRESVSVSHAGGGSSSSGSSKVDIPAHATRTIDVDAAVTRPGEHFVTVRFTHDDSSAEAQLTVTVPDYYRADYGELLPAGDAGAAVWWCTATHKIHRGRKPPTMRGAAATISAARNDYEAVQIVVRPDAPLKGLRAEAGPLVGKYEAGGSIAADNVKIHRVYYHFVDHPTDSTGVRDWWPDALPSLEEPIDVPAGENQPLWVLVYVPQDAKAGDYRGEIRLEAEGWSAAVPVKLRVWDFALPERNHLETAFGFSAGNVFRYHQLKTDEEKRRVLDMYLRSFSEHRISPYDPAPMDPIRAKFLPEADPPRAEVDFSAFDSAMTRAVEDFHFTGLRLRVEGMGGGTFHARHEPSIAGYGENTLQYQAMFADYVKKLEGHFREKGWLEMPYIYWFDEPAPKDYAFVRGGMERIKKHAPELTTMLTEQPEEELAGAIDVWCPISNNYDHEAAQKRRAHGERFWWYVCTGPKAPYCTLFIDHPATELRVWLWQTWKRNISGILVWQANYWTSSAAFPDAPQNPYEDPMGYRSGYSTPRGVKRFWGNGDGRFIYPPLAAAVPGASGSKPVVGPPASSIRWEMLREGIEDWEYHYLLRERLEGEGDRLSADEVEQYEALLVVPESITQDMTTFTTNPAPIYARRQAIAEAIERLGGR
ncbi:MAG: DUF4091 domain-containing protein [Planctomycetota bacterium]|jgi:hypothetical protein